MWAKVFLSYATCMSVTQLLIQILYAGITEVQIIQWYVEEGAHIEEWKPLCQYQSDKAVDDVSKFFSIPLSTYLTIYQSR
jgi:2-oxoisovalerate dehydrogenase E2 component (dihydrolipoyl transacylase)